MTETEKAKFYLTHPYADKKMWIYEAKTRNLNIKVNKENSLYIKWKDGIWEDGTWEYGTWLKGLWRKGTWLGGVWIDGTWEDGTWENGTWETGVWKNGDWIGGAWKEGKWEDGIWRGGIWFLGHVLDKNTGEYKISEVPPNKCKWSCSYERN